MRASKHSRFIRS